MNLNKRVFAIVFLAIIPIIAGACIPIIFWLRNSAAEPISGLRDILKPQPMFHVNTHTNIHIAAFKFIFYFDATIYHFS